MSVTHLADVDREPLRFVDVNTLAPIPPLCDEGTDGDLMTFDIRQVSCSKCFVLHQAAVPQTGGPTDG